QYRHVVSRVVKVLQDVFVSSNRQLRRPASPVGKVVVLTWRYFILSIRKGDYPGTYKIFFISVKTLINENSLFFDLNHFLVFTGK
ncbi:hypothetical protein ONR49_25830, partial [Salmonella enterica subsp. enterica serovar Virginia]|nr:hypothetical protein [Salmonella enterica subsp. enterica serovar Virginia]